MTPAAYGRGGRGMEIHYTITPTAIGRVLVAGTGRGICAVYLGRSDARLIAALRKEYPSAKIQPDVAKASKWVRQIVRHLSGANPRLDLPLDIQGTAFQRRVWDALRRIPYGETRSYTEIARQLGRPEARRAVARACASNPVCLVIPCHRVIRSDGTLGGYGGGIENKRKLLEQESAQARKHPPTARSNRRGLGSFFRAGGGFFRRGRRRREFHRIGDELIAGSFFGVDDHPVAHFQIA